MEWSIHNRARTNLYLKLFMMILHNVFQNYWKNIRLDLKFAVIFSSVSFLILLFISLVFVKFGSYEKLQSKEKFFLQQKARLLVCMNQELETYLHNSNNYSKKGETTSEDSEMYHWLNGADCEYLKVQLPASVSVLNDISNSYHLLYKSYALIEDFADANILLVNLSKYTEKSKEYMFQLQSQVDKLELLIANEELDLEKLVNRSNISFKFTLLIIGGFALFFIVVMSLILSKDVLKPVYESISFTKQISQGRLDGDIQVNDHSDLGMLASALLIMKDRLSNIIHVIQKGNWSVKKTVEKLDDLAGTMNDFSMDQSSSVQEIYANMGEIENAVVQNAKNAKESEKFSKDIHVNMHKVAALSETNLNTSKEIMDKIQRVNAFAKQTNILALNAAVEAARVGKYGKGFGVVAGEIRNLADLSSGLANDIISVVNKSFSISEDMTKSIDEIIPYVDVNTELIKEISQNSTEQSYGISEIKSSLGVLSSGIQDKTDITGKLFSSSKQLSEETLQLSNVMLFFKGI